jgi:Cytochrome c7 and related cytochrome c
MRPKHMFAAVLFFMCSLSALGVLAQLLSPGELSKDHARLEGDTQCTQCHSSGRSVETGLCTKCHTDIGADLRAGKGLHGREFKSDPCAHCHVEHRGAAHELVRWPGGSRERFDHTKTGFALRGAHQKASCNDCHKHRSARGAPTLLGASSACGSCHEDPHEKRFGDDCKSCHNDSAWRPASLTRFDHDRARFSLEGKHQQVACATCHGEPAKYRGLAFERCTSCHDDPHRDKFGGECTSCHGEASWQKVDMKRATHPGLSILGGHARVACTSCHDQGLSAAPKRGSRCVSCHAAVHEAKFGNNCGECHKGIRWLGLPEPLGREVHARTAFPLRGDHERVDCEACHSRKLPAKQRFRELRYERCLDCHQDSHRGEFAKRDAGECRACHDEHGFRPSLFDHQAHAGTAFPLLGSHIAVPCASCHGSQRPRLDFRLQKQQCADCHENPHGDQFAKELQTRGCAHCHSEKSWHEPSIDHSTWPLTGAHGLVACAACHTPTQADAKAGAGASYRGVPRDCEGCHDDVHRGQFRLTAPRRACRDCHDTAQFELARFDHERMTGYALEGGHERVACEACHRRETLRNGETAVRYRLTYRRCADCHADPHSGAP